MSGNSGLYIGLDVGTQSTKGVVLDAELEGESAVVARASKAYGLIEGLPPGAAEQHPETWSDAVGEVLGKLLGSVDKSRVRGIGVSGQQHGLVTLGEDDKPVRAAKLWCDSTTVAEADQISAAGKWPVPTG